ncbi:hypothetical protein ACFY8W_04510 [Streptomyces sp. NPDC012637]|uniref:hypothetical protein n=1 Tax=Streptomyces sp. NPDC012637 TaxID=3364842 RepID=UPI0036E23B49
MFSLFHRRKGGAPELGATAPGEMGPFGVSPHPDDVGRSKPDRPVLARWMKDADMSRHPLGDLFDVEEAELWLGVLDQMLSDIDAIAGEDRRWKDKRAEFAKLTSMSLLLDMRAEFTMAIALASRGISYQLGNTSVRNPDFLVEDVEGTIVAGLEVTTAAPLGMTHLAERIEHELRKAGLVEVGVRLTFSHYPTRLKADVQDAIIRALLDRAPTVVAGGITEPVVVECDDALVNAGRLTVTVRVETSKDPLDWEVSGAELAGPMASAVYAALNAGTESRKAEQGRSLAPAPVLLAVDLSRYGAAWMRSGWVWAQTLAASEHFTSGYPFAGVAVFGQSLVTPDVVGIGVAISPHLAPAGRQQLERLCKKLGWAHHCPSPPESAQPGSVDH